MIFLPEIGDHAYRGSEELDQPLSLAPLGLLADGVVAFAREAMTMALCCESPIETQIGAHLRLSLPERFTLIPQFRFDRYRMDFAILLKGKPCLFIECDGKEFHSTKQQLANDAAKDRAAVSAGIPLLRLTGSEIYRHPHGCCESIIAILGGM